jgi:hypothetical protein
LDSAALGPRAASPSSVNGDRLILSPGQAQRDFAQRRMLPEAIADGTPQFLVERNVVQRLPHGFVLGFGQAVRDLHGKVQLLDQPGLSPPLSSYVRFGHLLSSWWLRREEFCPPSKALTS